MASLPNLDAKRQYAQGKRCIRTNNRLVEDTVVSEHKVDTVWAKAIAGIAAIFEWFTGGVTKLLGWFL